MKLSLGTRVALAATLIIAGPACNDDQTPTPSNPTTTTVTQPLLDSGEPNWMVAGVEGFVEMVGGTDGEPDVVTGRFVMNTQEVRDAASAADRWVLVGLGQSQPVDNDALRLRDARTILQGESANFIKAGSTGWLTGGEGGRLQTLDAEGEPTADEALVFAGRGSVAVQDAAWNGNNWLVSGGGWATTCNPGLSCPSSDGQAVLGGAETIAVVTVAEPDNNTSISWVLYSPDSYQIVNAQGTPQPLNLIEAGLDLTDAIYANGKIALATADGRFAVIDAGATPTWQNVLGGVAATKIEWNGTDEYLILGVDGWAQRAGADGVPLGSAVQVATQRDLVAARYANGRWMMAVGDIGFVEFAGTDLAPLRTLQPVFSGGQDILTSSATDEGVLVGGDEGRLRFLDDQGIPLGAEIVLDGNPTIRGLAWNGSAFLAVGDDGFTQLLDERGNAMGSSTTHYDGNTIRFVAWSGEFWLIGGDGGAIQRVRTDGTKAGNPVAIPSIATFYDGGWSGREWLAAGTSDDQKAAYVMVQSDGTPRAAVVLNAFAGAAYATEWNGLEWILGGTDGKAQRINAEGTPVSVSFDVLAPYDISDIFFNTENYLVGGEFGAVRRMSVDLMPLRLPIAVIDQKPVGTIIWTRPRGFASGLCVSSDLCYEGPCVGGLLGGKCCDTACDRPCESCFNRDTNGVDGECASVVAGKQPPNNNGCDRQSADTCGFTGFCDGAGDCQFYGNETECESPLCVSGDFTPPSICDGAGACDVESSTSCGPYNSCTENGCTTSCGSDSDCVAGYHCDASICIEDEETPDKPDEVEEEDTGCCSTVRSGPTSSNTWVWVIASLIGLFWSRRRYEIG